MVFDESDQLKSDQEEKRHEKFSRERGSDYMDRGGGRRNFGGPDRREYSNGIVRKRPYHDVDIGLTAKRSKFDGALDSYEPQFNRKDMGEQTGTGGSATQQLLTFKKFLVTQDESLTDEQAIAKYLEYKMEFMKQECEQFFQAHKDEEWFRLKYHPEDGKLRIEEQRQNLQKRFEIFNEFNSSGQFEGLALNYDKAEEIIRKFNAVVVKLEGGSDADIEAANGEEIDDESVLDLLTPEQLKQRQTEKKKREAEEKASEAKSSENNKNTELGTEEEMETADGVVERKPSLQKRFPPNKTRSIHFRSIPGDVPLADLENLCKQHPGFLRLAITDPQPDSKGKPMRSAWATYRWDVNIKDIFWALRNAKLNGVELGASVNRELRRRVRTIGATNGLAAHRPIVKNDIRNAAKLVVLLDLKAGFYKEEAEEGEDQAQGGDQTELADLEAAVLRSRNPLLAGIRDHLVEETSAEEETLQKRAALFDGGEVTQEYEVDQQAIELLDRLLLYLRLVHSMDYYAASQYPSEDDMPHRLGIVHVRGRPPSSAVQNWPCTDRGIPLLSKDTVDAHIDMFNRRLQAGLLKKVVLAESELAKLGKKDPEKAVQEFINTNTQQLGPEKWLCPLSGKKFKGPEFVQKHLHSKYAKEIEGSRHDALYFNNFLADPNRPHSPIFAKGVQHPGSGLAEERRERSASPPPPAAAQARAHRSSGEENAGVRQAVEPAERTPYQRGNWGGGGGPSRFGGGGRPAYGGGSGFGPPPRRPFYEPMNELGGGRKDPRAPPSYRDLDAPAEDIF